MFARALVLSAALALAAASHAAPPVPDNDPNSPDNELPLASDLLANAPLKGTWEAVGDGATVGVRFTPKSYPNTLTIGCNGGNNRAFINWTLKDPTENGTVRVYTAAKTVAFDATAMNDGMHLLGVEVDGKDPRLDVLKVQQSKFAVQGFGQAIVVPWDARIADTLKDCAG